MNKGISIKLNNIGFLILSMLISYIFIGNMLAVFSAVLPFRDWITLIIAVFGCALLFFTLFRSCVKKDNVLLILGLFILFTIVPTYIENSGKSSQYGILQIGNSLLWVAVLTFSYLLSLKHNNLLYKSQWLALTIPIYSLLFLGVKQFSDGQGIALISTAYYVLFLLPFAFMIQKKWLKWLLVLISFSTVLLSVKRTGFVAIILSIFVYFIYDIKYSEGRFFSKRKIRLIFGFLILFVVLYVFFIYYTSTHSIAILDRMNSIEDDNGSGRADIWKYTWQMIKDSEPEYLIFGHGFNAVYTDSSLELSAHTDVLEVIYDYGIIGSLIYIAFWCSLFKYFKKVKAYIPQLAAPYAVSLVLMICMSAVAHLIIYPTHFIFLCMFWGLVFGELDRGDDVVERRTYYATISKRNNTSL